MKSALRFIVIGVSGSPNSFGLWGHIVVNQRGHAYEIGLNDMRKHKANDILRVPMDEKGTPIWASIGAEIPQRKKDMPPELLKTLDFDPQHEIDLTNS